MGVGGVCVWWRGEGGTTTGMHVYWSYLALVGDDPAFDHDPLVRV